MPSVQRIRAAKLRSLLLVLAAICILSVLVYLLLGGNPLAPDVLVRTYVIDSGGLAPGAPVRLNGIRVGKVEKVELAEQPRGDSVVEIVLKIDAAVARHIAEDSIVEIGAENLLGDMLIEITGGKSPRPVTPGGELTYQPPAEIDRARVIASLERNLRLVDVLLSDIEAGRGTLGRFLRDDTLYENANASLRRLELSLQRAASAGLLGDLIHNDTMYDTLGATMKRYDAVLADLAGGRGAAGRLLNSSEQYENLRQRIARLRSTIASLEKNRFLASDRDYEAWNREVRKLIAAVDEITLGEGSLARLLHSAHTYESLAGAARNLRDGLQEFQENPRKFLRIDLNLF